MSFRIETFIMSGVLMEPAKFDRDSIVESKNRRSHYYYFFICYEGIVLIFVLFTGGKS